MTSSDVLDTATAVSLRDAGDLLVEEVGATDRRPLKSKALEHRDTVMAGRTHGVHAEPTTFGLKLAGWVFETAPRTSIASGAARDARRGGQALRGRWAARHSCHPEVEALRLRPAGPRRWSPPPRRSCRATGMPSSCRQSR